MADKDPNQPSLWQKMKPKLVDAGIIAGGFGLGMGTGSLLENYIKSTRAGQHWERTDPDVRMKYIIPAMAILGAGTMALTAVRDSYRHKEPDKTKYIVVDRDGNKMETLQKTARMLARIHALNG